MKCFVWDCVKQCSDNYHSGGGVVVFAETEERARELANQEEGCCIEADEIPEVRECSGEEGIFIFPDAGCC